MKKFLVVTLVSCLCLSVPVCVLPAGAISETVNQERGSVSVSYTAEKEVSPDTVEVSIAVKTDDKKSMQEAVRKNKEISEKIYSYLKSQINTSQGDYVKTSNFSASPSYIYSSNKRVLDKYEVSNNVIVHIKSLDKISTIIDKSLNLGATDVDSLKFLLSEKDEQCVELLSKATKQVKKRADIVASAAGTSVVGIRNIDTSCSVNNSGNRFPTYRNSLMVEKASAAAMGAEDSAPANIEVGTIKIHSSVNATFYLK